MTRAESLLKGKFKNIPFKVRRESIPALGQRYVMHDYYSSSSRYMEAQGVAPVDFSVDVFFSGQDFQDDFRRFQAAVDDATPGTLILPTYGVYTSMVAYGGSSEASQTEVGEIKLAINFTRSINRPSPSNQLQTAEDVAAQAEATRRALQSEFEGQWQPPTTGNNITTASFDLRQLSRDVTQRAAEIARASQQFVRRVDNALRSSARLSRLLLNPAAPVGYLQNAATSITGTESFRAYLGIASAGSGLPAAMNDISAGIRPAASSGVVQPAPAPAVPDVSVQLWPGDTAERRQRNANRASAINAFRAVGLVGMYEAASTQTYTTTDDIDRVKAQLDLYYELIVEDDATGAVIPGIITELSRLKNVTDQVLSARRQNAYAVVEITIPMYMPDTLLAYDLYGERIQSEAQLNYIAGILRGLNAEQPAHRLGGAVRVVELR